MESTQTRNVMQAGWSVTTCVCLQKALSEQQMMSMHSFKQHLQAIV